MPPRVAVAPPVVAPAAFSADEKAGTAALEKDDMDGAIAAFTLALNKKEAGANPLYDNVMRGIAYAKKGQFEQALADFDAAVKIKPDDVDARFRRGSTRAQLKQYQDAIEDLTAVIQADAMNAAAFRVRGFAHNMLNQNTDGAADTDKACALNKDFCL